MKRYILITISVITVLFLLTGCSDKEEPEPVLTGDSLYIYDEETGGAKLVYLKEVDEELSIPAEVDIAGSVYPVTSIGDQAFVNYKANKANISALYLPPTIKFISSNTFNGVKVDKLYIEDIEAWCGITFESVESDYYYNLLSYGNPISSKTEFYIRGERVTDLVIPGTVKTLNPLAFRYLNIRSLIIEEGVEEIGHSAFSGCKELERISLPLTLHTVGRNVFGDSPVSHINIPSADFWPTLELTNSFSLPVDVNIKEDRGYSDFIKYIKLPFTSKYSLYVGEEEVKEITVSGMKKEVPAFFFYDCQLETIRIEEGVEEIGAGAFENCSALTSVHFPSTINQIYYCFNGCDNLKSIELKSLIPPIFEDWYYYDYKGIVNNLNRRGCVLSVPAGSIEFYREDPFWGLIENIEAI